MCKVGKVVHTCVRGGWKVEWDFRVRWKVEKLCVRGGWKVESVCKRGWKVEKLCVRGGGKWNLCVRSVGVHVCEVSWCVCE